MGLSRARLEPRTAFKTAKRDSFKGFTFSIADRGSASGTSVRFTPAGWLPIAADLALTRTDPGIIAERLPDPRRKPESQVAQVSA